MREKNGGYFMKIILASKSPRRKELLSMITNDFDVIVSNVEEKLDKNLIPEEQAKQLSYIKAKAVFNSTTDLGDRVVIGGDTIVVKDGKIFGKPKDKDDAKRMLKELSNSFHQVKTVYTILSINKHIEITRIITSIVYFNKLSPQLIDDYIITNSPLDKAGGYGIQDKTFNLVNHIEGSYTNIVGLPIEELKKDLQSLKIIA